MHSRRIGQQVLHGSHAALVADHSLVKHRGGDRHVLQLFLGLASGNDHLLNFVGRSLSVGRHKGPGRHQDGQGRSVPEEPDIHLFPLCISSKA
ncbi:MAG: hypothetical protein ACK56I_32245 [bacterium]